MGLLSGPFLFGFTGYLSYCDLHGYWQISSIAASTVSGPVSTGDVVGVSHAPFTHFK